MASGSGTNHRHSHIVTVINKVPRCNRIRDPNMAFGGSTDHRHHHGLRRQPRITNAAWCLVVTQATNDIGSAMVLKLYPRSEHHHDLKWQHRPSDIDIASGRVHITCIRCLSVATWAMSIIENPAVVGPWTQTWLTLSGILSPDITMTSGGCSRSHIDLFLTSPLPFLSAAHNPLCFSFSPL